MDDNALRDFKETIVRKYGRLWGFYREELEKAIKERTEKLREDEDVCKEVGMNVGDMRGESGL